MGHAHGKPFPGFARLRRWLLAGGIAAALPAVPALAQAPSPRVALVIGIGGYAAAPTPAAPDDAGLVAQTLQGAGFDVTAARDLDGNALRQAVRDFLDKAGTAGPDGIAVVYLAGRAVQADGDNFFVPVDARLARPADVPIETVRLGDITHALAALPIQAKVVVVDAAYAGGPGQGPAGLALVEAEQGELVAFNAAPGSVAPATQGPYGFYAQALVQALQEGGVPVSEIFARVRLAVDQASGGAEIPWDSDKLTRSFTFFDRGPAAPAVSSAQIPFAALEKRPIRDFPPDQAYDVAIARDTLPAYQDFLAAFPDSPLARRIRLIVAVRREALTWRATLAAGTPAALWTYLARYPRGPHVADARRRLARLAAAAGPPPDFRPVIFDVPPPPPGEIVVIDRPVVFVDPGLPPPPPPPVFLLPPVVAVALPPPPPPRGPRFLPIPVPVPLPGVRPLAEPGEIAPPRGVGGAYGRPRPYRRGPGGDGLVGQDGPEPPPPGAAPIPGPARPLPPGGGPGPARTVPAPRPLPAPAPAPPPGDAPPSPAPAMPPPPAGRLVPPPPGPGPGRPLRPVPGAGPLPAPPVHRGVPPAPVLPAPGPAAVPPPDVHPRIAPPGGAEPRAVHPPAGGAPPPPVVTPAPAASPQPGPGAGPRPDRRPRPGAPGVGGMPPRPPAAPAEAPPPLPAAPHPGPDRGPAGRPRPEPGAPPAMGPGPGNGGPRPPGGEIAHPPAGRGGGERHRPDCGHPGQPPCG